MTTSHYWSILLSEYKVLTRVFFSNLAMHARNGPTTSENIVHCYCNKNALFSNTIYAVSDRKGFAVFYPWSFLSNIFLVHKHDRALRKILWSISKVSGIFPKYLSRPSWCLCQIDDGALYINKSNQVSPSWSRYSKNSSWNSLKQKIFKPCTLQTICIHLFEIYKGILK